MEDYINVKDAPYLAKGDGVTDDTVAVQTAVNTTSDGGTLYFPNGTYMILATGSSSSGANGGVQITRPIKIVFENNAMLKAIPGNKTSWKILDIENTSNVEICGGSLLGDRDTHIGNKDTSGGEFGYPIFANNSYNIYIHDMNISKAWGDCIFLGASTNIENNFRVERVNIDSSRRWGLYFGAGGNLTAKDCVFSNCGDANLGYGGGIDIEDDYHHGGFNNITIVGCRFENNNINGAITSQVSLANARFEGNTFLNNNYGINMPGGNLNGVLIQGNHFDTITQPAIRIQTPGASTTNVRIKGNSFYNCAIGIQLGGTSDSVCSNILIEGNMFDTIDTTISSSLGTIKNLNIASNIFTANRVPISLTPATNVSIVNNTFINGTLHGVIVSGNKTTVIGNQIINCAKDGIFISGSECAVGNNTIISAVSAGISVQAVNGCVIFNNFIDSNGTFGIWANNPPTGTSKVLFLNNTLLGVFSSATTLIHPAHLYSNYNKTFTQASRGISAGTPTTGTYEAGEWLNDSSFATSGYFAMQCQTKGTMDTIKTTCTANGSAVVTIASATGLYAGMYVAVNGISTQITAVNGASVTLATTITAGSGLTFVNSPATWKKFGALV